MEEKTKTRPCPHDCRKCSLPQQVFCSAQMTFTLSEQVSNLKERMEKMAEKFDTLFSGELSLPNNKAQSEGGADNRLS